MSILTLFCSLGVNLINKYPLISNLLDSVSGATGTLTRSTVKTFYTDAGAVSSAAIDTAAFTGSGVLIEPADTNVMLYANNCNNAAWGKTNMTATTVDVVGSDGSTTTAGTLTNTATGAAACYLAQGVTITNNAVVIFKLIVKKGSGDYLVFDVWNAALTGAAGYWFNLTTGAVGTYNGGGGGMSATASTKTLANGFYELKMTVQCSGTMAYCFAYIVNSNSSYAQTTGKTMIYESFTAQYKDTSPIITSGAALTRTVDALTVPTTNWLANDFAIYLEIDFRVVQSSTTEIYFKTTNTGAVQVERTNNDWTIYVNGTTGASRSHVITLAPSVGTTYKLLLTANPTETKAYVNASTSTLGGINDITSWGSVATSNGANTGNFIVSTPKFINTSSITLAQAEAL